MAELEYGDDRRSIVKKMLKDALGAGQQVVSERQKQLPLGPVTPASSPVPEGAPEGASAHDSGITMALRGDKPANPENVARDWIIQKESSGKTNAQNPTSSAFGLGQLIIANRRAYGKKLGIDPNTTDYDQQLALMDAYVKERYGTYEAAKRFWEENRWY